MKNARGLVERFERAVAPVLGAVAAVVLFALMALTCTDVIGRYFLSQPVPGARSKMPAILAMSRSVSASSVRCSRFNTSIVDSAGRWQEVRTSG